MRPAILATAWFVAGWGLHVVKTQLQLKRAWKQHRIVEDEAMRILPGLREQVVEFWRKTEPRGPVTIAKAFYSTTGYEGRHRAPLEDTTTYQRRTLKPGWRPPTIPTREVFRA